MTDNTPPITHPLGDSPSPFRARLLAKIHEERAGLLEALVGLDEKTLVDEPIVSGWTARDLLAHIAAWDDLFTQRIGLIRASRAGEMAGVELDERNAALHEERKDWPLDRALEAFISSRTDFLATLAEVTDEELHRVHTLPWGEATIRRWAEFRHKHDREHAAEVLEWKKGRGNEVESGFRPVMLAALRAGFEEFLASAALIADGERDARVLGGGWTLAEILGHLADWNEFAARHLRPLTTGGTPTVQSGGDIDSWNAAHVEARRGQPWRKALADLRGSARSLEDVFASIDPPDLTRPFPSPWRSEDTAYHWFRIWLHHYRDHAGGIRGSGE